MFENMTIEDYRDWIKFHLDKTVKETEREISLFRMQANSRGMSGTGHSTIATIEKALDALERGLDTTLSQLKRVIKMNKLDPHQLRSVTGQLLEDFSERQKNATGYQRLMECGHSEIVTPLIPSFEHKVRFALRQFDVGLNDPLEPETPLSMTNNVSIGVMSNSILQQGASQEAMNSSDTTICVQSALRTLEVLERALEEATLSHEKQFEILGDIATIKAQLTKPKPTAAIINESLKTIRNVAEGLVAGAITQPTINAAQAVLRALGLNS